MNVRRTLTWIAVAALGVGLTTALTITTTLLSQQPVALASEPLSAGDTLVPQRALAHPKPATTVARRVKKARARRHAATTPNISPPVPTPRVPTPRVVVPLPPASIATTPRVAVSSGAQGASSGDGASGEQRQAHDSQSGQDNADD